MSIGTTTTGPRVFTIAEARARGPDALPRCSQCTHVAESWHSFYGEPSQLACSDHDPGGYWLMLYGGDKKGLGLENALQGGIEHWLAHLADQHPSVASDLLRWLATDDGLTVLRKIARYRHGR
jgi:hypothetical protein